MTVTGRVIVGLMMVVASMNLYCSSPCIAHESVCSSATFGDCTVCATSIYTMVPDQTGCVLLNQTQIMSVDLTAPISLSGWATSQPVPFSCGAYGLSGLYGMGDYLSKTFQVGVPHYLLKVRFVVAFMGSWSSTEGIVASIDGKNQSFLYTCLEYTS